MGKLTISMAIFNSKLPGFPEGIPCHVPKSSRSSGGLITLRCPTWHTRSTASCTNQAAREKRHTPSDALQNCSYERTFNRSNMDPIWIQYGSSQHPNPMTFVPSLPQVPRHGLSTSIRHQELQITSDNCACMLTQRFRWFQMRSIFRYGQRVTE